MTNLTELTFFDFGNSGTIIDLYGIEKMTSLKYVDIRDFRLKNINSLGFVHTLKQLTLFHRGEITYDFLEGLTQLDWLSLFLNDNSDFFDLGHLKKLQYIHNVSLINNSTIKKMLT